jgi:hypothetical protein
MYRPNRRQRARLAGRSARPLWIHGAPVHGDLLGCQHCNFLLAGGKMTTDVLDAIVDYRAESRAGAHVLDVAARSQEDGVLHLELTVSDRVGEVIGEGDLRLPPDALPPAERFLGQVLRGLSALHTLPPPERRRRPDDDRDGGGGRPNARRSWSDGEQDRLRDEWDRGESLERIAAAHGRTRNAISSRLLKLGLIDADSPESPIHPETDRT